MTLRAETADGRREEHALTMRQWYREELVPLLQNAGFSAIDVRSGVDHHTLSTWRPVSDDQHIRRAVHLVRVVRLAGRSG
jgi:hypothetical protein